MNIRQTTSADVPSIAAIADATELFPGKMTNELVASFLAGDRETSAWLTCEDGGQPVAFCYAVPEQLADGVWNMLAIGVSPDQQGRGVGTALTDRLETDLRANEARMVIADTSGTDAFKRTRAFYAKRGYEEEARIRDFWARGDDKVTFRKLL